MIQPWKLSIGHHWNMEHCPRKLSLSQVILKIVYFNTNVALCLNEMSTVVDMVENLP